ncbi:MAG: AzlC family ABC transporter permease [Dethiobacteraceae bacterium]
MKRVEQIQVFGTGMERKEFWLAARESAPIIVGAVPFGITCGIMGVASGLKPLETILMSVLVFAGAAQFIGITMLAAGISGWDIVFTTLLINLRHLLIGASLAPHLVRLPLPKQALLAFGMVDESYALTASRIPVAGYNEYYQLGSNTSFYLAWTLSTIAGVYLGGHIPDPLAWGLDFAMPATFIVLLVPRLLDRVSMVVCLVAAVTTVMADLYLPGKWYIIIACLAASIAGGLMEKRGSNNAE